MDSRASSVEKLSVLGRAKRGLARAWSALLGGCASVSVFAIIVGIWAVSCWSNVASVDTPNEGSSVSVVEVERGNELHEEIQEALAMAWLAAGFDLTELTLRFVETDEINAASFGDGVFLFWEGIGELPGWAIEAIAAHEVAHDVLLHSRRSRDLTEFLGFFAEVFGILSGADRHQETAIHTGLQNVTVPTYSRRQENAADRLAIHLLGQMGFDEPHEVLAATLGLLLERYGDTGGGLLDSHPATSERIQRVLSQHESAIR